MNQGHSNESGSELVVEKKLQRKPLTQRLVESWDTMSIVGKIIERPPSRTVLMNEGIYRLAGVDCPEAHNPVVFSTLHPFSTLWICAQPWSLAEIEGIIVYFHGAGSVKGDSLCFGYDISLACKVLFIVVEYPGYEYEDNNKWRSVTISQQWSCRFLDFLTDSWACYALSAAASTSRIPGKMPQVILMGHCLGADICLAVASRKKEFVSGIILISVFETLKEMLKRFVHPALSLCYFAFRNHMNHLSKEIADLKCPILSFSLKDDRWCPPASSLKVLECASKSPYRKQVEVTNRGHYFSLFAEGLVLAEEISLFLKQASPSISSTAQGNKQDIQHQTLALPLNRQLESDVMQKDLDKYLKHKDVAKRASIWRLYIPRKLENPGQQGIQATVNNKKELEDNLPVGMVCDFISFMTADNLNPVAQEYNSLLDREYGQLRRAAIGIAFVFSTIILLVVVLIIYCFRKGKRRHRVRKA